MVINVDWFFLSHRLPIAKAAAEAGWDVHIATSLTESAAALRSHHFTIHPLQMHRTAAGPGLLRSLLDLLKIFRSVRPDVLHLVTIKPVLLGGLAARISRVPAVVYAISGLGHVFSANGLSSRLRKVFVRALYRVALGAHRRKLIFQNPFDMAEVIQMAGVSDYESILIPGSGFDVDSYEVAALPSSGPIVFLMASRLLHTKGVVEFCSAAEILDEEFGDVEFWLAGSLDEANPASITPIELDEIRSRGYVKVLGFQANIPDLMRKAHVVVLPSYYAEGLPKILIEAAACGRPVVSTDMPGCRDALEHGLTGLLVPPKDSNALADAMRVLIHDRKLMARMGTEGRRRAEKVFRIQDVIKHHLGIYTELTAVPNDESCSRDRAGHHRAGGVR